MHTLVVVAHPERKSLSHQLASTLASTVAELSKSGTVEIADLAAEGFDPRFTEGDLKVHRFKAPPPDDVKVEQDRIDRADALVLLFPIYWWGMPALLKGWIDRVFSNGWAFDYEDSGPNGKRLGHLSVHLLALAGGSEATFQKHGYDLSVRTSIDHGIFHYCGSPVSFSRVVHSSETGGANIAFQAVRDLANALVLPKQLTSAPACGQTSTN